MNTRLTYMYRDASNYKNYGCEIVEGWHDDAEKLIRENLDQGMYFIAAAVELPEVFFDTHNLYDDDHNWHELVCIEETVSKPTMSINIITLIGRFAVGADKHFVRLNKKTKMEVFLYDQAGNVYL